MDLMDYINNLLGPSSIIQSVLQGGYRPRDRRQEYALQALSAPTPDPRVRYPIQQPGPAMQQDPLERLMQMLSQSLGTGPSTTSAWGPGQNPSGVSGLGNSGSEATSGFGPGQAPSGTSGVSGGSLGFSSNSKNKKVLAG